MTLKIILLACAGILVSASIVQAQTACNTGNRKTCEACCITNNSVTNKGSCNAACQVFPNDFDILDREPPRGHLAENMIVYLRNAGCLGDELKRVVGGNAQGKARQYSCVKPTDVQRK